MVSLEIKKEDRTYSFLMPIGSPFGEAYDAAFAVLAEINKMSQEAVETAKREEDDPKKESKVKDSK